jgi:hypothetical protein
MPNEELDGCALDFTEDPTPDEALEDLLEPIPSEEVEEDEEEDDDAV